MQCASCVACAAPHAHAGLAVRACTPCNLHALSLPRMCNRRNVHDITLSYTFYKVDDEDATNLDDSGGVKLHASGPIPAGITLAPGVKLPPGVGPAAPPAAASEPAGAPDGAPAGAGS